MRQNIPKTFTINNDLGFLIQSITGQNTESVVSYFYGCSSEIIDKLRMKKDRRWWRVTRELKSLYPGTYVPFRMQIHAFPDEDEKDIIYHVTVDFSSSKQEINVEPILQSILETTVFGSDSDVPKFNEPIRKAPAGMKHLKS